MTVSDLPLTIWALPLFTALVGWATNRLAVLMLFHPIESVGRPPFLGWQGVVPRRAEEMAHECIDRTLARSGDLTGLYQRLDPALITGEVVSRIMPHLEEYVDDVMYEHHPVLWDNLPRRVKGRIYHYVERNLPERVDAMVADFGEELGDLVDLRALMSEELRQHPDFMNNILQDAGASTFRFVIRSGAVIGLLMGVALAVGWTFWPSSWLLLGGGFIVGLLTNWIAITLIFRPRERKQWGSFRIQGLLMRRQPEISHIWGQRVAHELLTCEKVAHAIVHGEKAGRTRAIIQKHLRPLLDQSTVLRISTQMAVGASGYTELKKSMNDRALSASEEVFRDDAFNHDRARIVAELIEERIAGLSPEAFQSLLRPVFAAEEGRLMLAGGVCGLLAALVPVVLVGL